MNVLDIIIIIPVLWATYNGFRKGLIIELTTMLALGLGVWGGLHFSGFISDILKDAFSIQNEYLPIIAFTITFLLIVALVFALGKVLEKAINLIALKPINKILGACFGVGKMLFFISIAFYIVNSYDRSGLIPEEKKTGSLLYEPVSKVSNIVIPPGKQEVFF